MGYIQKSWKNLSVRIKERLASKAVTTLVKKKSVKKGLYNQQHT